MRSSFTRGTRLVVAVTLVAVLLAAVATPALASSGRGRGNGNTRGGPAVFTDVPANHWAWKHITAMRAKGILAGYGQGLFGPHNHVTRLELVVMVTRLIGAEDEALALDEDEVAETLAAAFHDYRAIPSWPGARECLAYALQEGYLWPLLQGRSHNFQPRTPATRLEVVVTLLEAMDLGDQARDMDTETLPFRDAAAVPLWARGYVALAVEIGLVKGDAGNLRPNKPITRCEMAALLDRADEDIDTDLDRDIIVGTVVTVNVATSATEVSSITIVPGRFGQRYGAVAVPPSEPFGSVTYELAPAVVVIIDDEQADLSDVRAGDHVALYLDEDHKVLLIDVIDERAETSQVLGTLLAWTVDGTGRLTNVTVRRNSTSGAGGTSVTYPVAGGVELTHDGEEFDVSDLQVGLPLRLTLTGGAVTAIEILSPAPADEDVVRGTVTRVTIGSGTGSSLSSVSIIPEGGTPADEETYHLTPGAVVIVNDALGDLGDVRAGDEATLTLNSDDEVVLLKVEYTVTEVTGVLAGFVRDASGRLSTVTLERDGRTTTYLVDPDVVVTRDGQAASAGDLRLGDTLEVRIARGLVCAIDIVEAAG